MEPRPFKTTIAARAHTKSAKRKDHKVSEMSQQGAQLQGYNNELIKCIEDLSSKRDELHRQILLEEEEKQRVQHDLHILTERLASINESLAKKMAIRNDYDRTIAETEGAYKKILESSQSLLHVLKRESTALKEKAKTDTKPTSLNKTQ